MKLSIILSLIGFERKRSCTISMYYYGGRQTTGHSGKPSLRTFGRPVRFEHRICHIIKHINLLHLLEILRFIILSVLVQRAVLTSEGQQIPQRARSVFAFCLANKGTAINVYLAGRTQQIKHSYQKQNACSERGTSSKQAQKF